MKRTSQEILKTIHASMSNGIRFAEDAKKWLEEKGLSAEITHACFNSGQLHHRRDQNFIEELQSVGFITPSPAPTRTGKSGYSSFGKDAVVFPLKNEKKETVNFYAVRIHTQSQRTSYLNAEGIYPGYPPLPTTRLYLAKNIVDTASFLEAKILDNRDAVMALHEGELNQEHLEAIEKLTNLKEIIFII